MEPLETAIDEVKEMLPPDAVTLIRGEGNQLTNEITSIRITNEEHYKKAIELGSANTRVLKRIEAFRKAIVKPFEDQVANVNRMFKAISVVFSENDETLRSAVLKYIGKRKISKEIKTINVDTGRGTVRESFDFEITNPDDLDREWLTADRVKLGKQVRAGRFKVGEHKGFKVFKKPSIQFATK